VTVPVRDLHDLLAGQLVVVARRRPLVALLVEDQLAELEQVPGVAVRQRRGHREAVLESVLQAGGELVGDVGSRFGSLRFAETIEPGRPR